MRTTGATMAVAVMLGSASLLAGTAPAEARTDASQRDSRAAAARSSHTIAATPRHPGGGAAAAATAAPRQQAARSGRQANAGRQAPPRAAGTTGSLRYASFQGGISCVPYVREVTGMAITGNGRDWWHNAAGLYARGERPEPGSVLAFPGSGGMRSGHVAVVSRVLSAREVLIDHANWGGPGIRRGSVMRGVSVVDVSPANDWTEVRVQVGWDRGTYGRVYPTYGFIYNRPDSTGGTMLAGSSSAPRFQRSASAAGLGGRGQAFRLGGMDRWEELAEQPAGGSGARSASSPHASQHLDLSIRTLGTAGR